MPFLHCLCESKWISAPSYPLALVSLCHPHAAALPWAPPCVCGASAVRSHPHDRLRGEQIHTVSQSLELQLKF